MRHGALPLLGIGPAHHLWSTTCCEWRSFYQWGIAAPQSFDKKVILLTGVVAAAGVVVVVVVVVVVIS